MVSLNLDDVPSIKDIDKENMLEDIQGLASQCQAAVSLARRVELVSLPKIDSIVVLGMGGSGVGGDMARFLFEPELEVSFAVVKGYDLPAHIGKDSLVFAVSYSGNTEETLSTFDEAVRRKANLIVITSGGALKERALSADIPVIEVPSGHQPRAALGYIFFPILVSLERLGFIPDQSGDIKEALEVLKSESDRYSMDVPIDKNDTKKLAIEIQGKMPIIYGFEGIGEAACYRWKTQFNENGKSPAYWHVFSELDHNELLGWEQIRDISKSFHIIILRSSYEHRRITKRVGITISIMKDSIGGVSEVWAKGESRLAQLLSLIYTGDFVSTYLAVLKGIDPSPVYKIQHLKEELAKST